MNKTWFTLLKEGGDSLRDAFLQPGELVISFFAPVLEPIADHNVFLLSVCVAALVWISLLVGAWKLVKSGQRVGRSLGVAIRARLFLFKKKLPRRNGLLISCQQAGDPAPETEVEFDDLDLAVLTSAATLHQGFVLTAPDLAAQLKSRPMQVQSSLEKLTVNMMLERALGSTDDYDNYRLTRAGAAFVSMWQRNGD